MLGRLGIRTRALITRGSNCFATCTEQARADLASSYRICHALGFSEGVCNHLTMEVEPGRYLLIPHGLGWNEVCADDLLVVDGDGAVISGTGTAEISAVRIHHAIHSTRGSSARCVFHTHMPYTTSLTLTQGNKLPMLHQNCLRFHNDIASYDDYHGLVHDPDEGQAIVNALGDNRVLMMSNHGVLVTAETPHEALDDLYYLENAAKLVVLALSTGLPVREVDVKVREATAAACREERPLYAKLHFDALVRTLLAGGQDVRGRNNLWQGGAYAFMQNPHPCK